MIKLKLEIFILLLICISIQCLEGKNDQTEWEDKRNYDFNRNDVMTRLFDEITDSLENEFDQAYQHKLRPKRAELEQNQDDNEYIEYKKFFNYLINDNEEQVVDKKTRPKRFLNSLKDLFKSKNKTKPKHDEHTEGDFFDFIHTEPSSTTKHSTHQWSSYSSSSSRYSTSTKYHIIPSSTGRSSGLTGAAADDPFYRLKNHCATNYDRICAGKKTELNELVKKCQRLRLENPREKLEPCREVMSVYCYVFGEPLTCLGEDYDPYVPGRKKYTTSPTTTRGGHSIKVEYHTSTSTYKPIPITPRSTTTTRTTTTTTTTRKMPIITSSYTSKATSFSKPTLRPVTNGGDVKNPFNGPVDTIPNDADKLKEIGSFCLATKAKDQNCDKMLKMLKEKFKNCEKKPKTDWECQSFKVNFCTAYSNFPCCSDVLAGRTCSGKSVSQAKRMLYLM